MGLMFNGIGVSRGAAVGSVHRLQRHVIEIEQRQLASPDVPAEIDRFRSAVETAKQQLHEISDNIPLTLDVEISNFIETHLLMLDDHMLEDGTTRLIKEQQCNAEWALKQQLETIAQVFDAMEDDYLATRKDDIEHVVQRILRALQNVGAPEHDGFPHMWRDKIVLADDLTPADTIVMQHNGVAGFITESGGPLSHTAILARSLDIPAVVGVHEAHRYISNGETIVIDGNLGLVIANPDQPAIDFFQTRQRAESRRRRNLRKIRNLPSRMQCGTHVKLQANIDSEDDVAALRKVNAEGVGLYRTEYLYMRSGELPTEEEHFQVYTNVIRSLKGAPLTIRTADLGADKEINYPGNSELTFNPALGLRGVRRCLSEPAIFLPQVRAILRAAVAGPVNILIPMLTNVGEVVQIRHLIEQTKQELRREGIDFSEHTPVGGMIEVPASAIAARQFAQHLDFLSIGTNDLIQYTLAIDRIDDHVNYLYDPLHPAVLNLISTTIKAGERAGIPVGMCGEMAGDARYTRLLLAMGLRDFSMPPNAILEVKSVITTSDLPSITAPAKRVLASGESFKQQQLLQRLNQGVVSLESA